MLGGGWHKSVLFADVDISCHLKQKNSELTHLPSGGWGLVKMSIYANLDSSC